MKVKLVSCDGISVETDSDFFCVSNLLSNITIKGDTIPLPLLESGKWLEHISNFMKDYYNNVVLKDRETRTRLTSNEHAELLKEKWVKKYVDISKSGYKSLLDDCETLGVSPLVDLICRDIAENIIGKTETQISEFFSK